MESERVEVDEVQIKTYFEGGTRPIILGKQLVEAGWVIKLGIAPNKMHITGLVVQTSDMKAPPLEVKLWIFEKKWKCICSCKAGQGEKCKHISACLYHLLKNPVVPMLSATDLKQKWGKKGKEFSMQYNAVFVKNMCHIKQTQESLDIVSENPKKCSVRLMNVNTGCELNKMVNGRSKNIYKFEGKNITNNSSCNREFFKFIIEHSGLNKYTHLMQSCLTKNPYKAKFLEKASTTLNEAINICEATVEQNNFVWMNERKKRITASTSYTLYTYFLSKRTTDWVKKLKSKYDNNFKGNAATQHGWQGESLAKKIISKHCLYFEVGLVISPQLSFLAASPDGITYNEDTWKLIEIKSPVKGKYCDSNNLLSKLNYLKKVNNVYTLSKNHSYFGQIQLNLALTNLKTSDLVIYSMYSNTIEIIKVERDEKFIENYIDTLTKVYFSYILD